MKDDDEEEENTFGVQRYPCMPSLVALQQMRNRLHLAFLGRKLMKWTALATGRELRRLAAELYEVYEGFGEDVRNAFILLARSRYFCPQLNYIVTENIAKRAAVVVQQSTKQVSSVKIVQFEIFETEYPPYEHLGLEKGGQTILETKKAWLELLKRIIMMMQLRASFLMVEVANRNATKKWNVLSKLVIPRIKLSCHYITSELEEIEREDNFRLKRFKELKIKKNKEKEEVNKKDTCSCQKIKTGDGPEPCCMSSDKQKTHTQNEVTASVCCKENKEIDIFSSSQTESLAENNEVYQQDKSHSKPDNQYIFAACNSTAIEEEDKGPCVCLSSSSQEKPNFQRNIGAEGDTEKHEYIFASCKKTKKPSSSCNSIKTKQSEMSNVKSQMPDELDKTCSCEILETNNSDESICICEPLDKEESVCSCTLLKNPNIELVCSCEQLNKPIGKEFKVSFADKTIQTDNRKYSNTPRKESCQLKSTKVAVSFNDEQKSINDKYNSSCRPFKASFYDKATQIGYLSDPICSCTPSIKDDNKNNYIFSSCKKRVKGVHSDIPPHENANDNVKSGMCCSKSATKESMTRNTKSDQIRYSKPTIENEHNKPVYCESGKAQNKVSFQDKEIQTGFESGFPCKTLASSISLKDKMGRSEVGEYMRTFKEIVKVTKKPDKDGNMREERRMKTVKTEKKMRSDPIVSKKSYKQVSRTPSTASTDSSNTARKPCKKDTSTLTIVSQPISVNSNDSSQPVSESESLVQEVNFNLGDKSSNCSSKSLGSSTSHFKSCESAKSASSSCTSHNKRSGGLKPASNRLKVKIVSKPDEDSKQNNINETKFELTPSTFNLIKLILLGLSKSEASNKSSKIHQDQNTRIAKLSSGSKQKDYLIQKNVSYHSCSSEADKREPSTAITTCSCKDTNIYLKSQQLPCKCSSNNQAPSILSQSCDKIRDNFVNDFKTDHFGNKSRSLPIIDTPNCTCAKNVKEKPPLLQTTCHTKQQECSCQKNKTSPKFSCSSVPEVEKELSSCSCNKVPKEPIKTSLCNCKNEKYETERKSWKCNQDLFNESCEQESDKSLCESSRSTKSISDSSKICQTCNQQLSSTSSICNDSRNESNFSFKKSLRFSDSHQNKCNKSCSCSSQNKSNNSFKSCCSKSYQSSDSTTSQGQNSSKCVTTKVDASTSTRRSDKYDCRPLRLFMDKKQAECSSKSDTIILRVYKKSDSSFKQINRSRSYNGDD